MKKILLFISISILMCSAANGADYAESKKIDEMSDVGAVMTRTTRIPIQDMNDLDKLGVGDLGDFFGLLLEGDIPSTIARDSELSTHEADTTNVHGITDTSVLQLQPSEGAFANGDKTKLDGIEDSADVTDSTNVNSAGAVMESDFDATTFLYATSDNTPQPKTPAEVRTILSVEILADCFGITGGVCLDSDNGYFYSWDGDSVELVGVLNYQPLDGDLTSIAGLSTTSYGRNFNTLANEAALIALFSTAWADAMISNTHTHDGLILTKQTSAPGSPVAGRPYYADGSTWDPSGLGIGKAYYVVYDGTDYIPLWDEDGDWHFAYIELPTLEMDDLNDTSSPHTLLESELKNKVLSNGNTSGACELDFPARGEGWNFTYVIEAAYNVTLDPNGTEQWYLNGTQMAAGEAIVNESPTVGESIYCYSTERAVYCESKYTDWEEDTPP